MQFCYKATYVWGLSYRWYPLIAWTASPRILHIRLPWNKNHSGLVLSKVQSVFVDDPQWGAARSVRVENWDGGSTNGKLIRRQSSVHLITNSRLCIIDYWHTRFSKKKKHLCFFWRTNLNSRFSLYELCNHHHQNVAHHECKDRQTAMIVGSTQDTWPVHQDKKGDLPTLKVNMFIEWW